ncbi:hypothetical protein ANOM_001665 [Aspergillus nomiae NRRL 13137]|uniref:Uncharacterized protein n=1 Tax=Aspergillus nomiae NRRL (strain ATCC 15546 / NRRL 13137 / CBS 260.88 / M93) TaxID=1509407 RepID=A0A0L1JDW0_ASPN3|nr:uncharacterized protein ANOM_001665 [Aspergillus nomiae NRRL 13137]KNG89917.1 hypothetical protein ANOM_001665 [Aspergillus nomiae NRRL 13137]
MMVLKKTLLLLSILSAGPVAASKYDIRLDTTATNLGPLTTRFTPPASCSDIRTRDFYGYYPKLEMGCEGPGGNECCPPNWRDDVYYSPGMCPAGYQTCTLPTSKQRIETTAMCCPDNFACNGQGSCTRPLNTRIALTMTGATHTTTRTAYAITATPIQIRFKAAESTIVPIPTASLRLPRGYLYKREKIGVGIGVSAAVIGIAIGVYFCCCSGRKQRMARVPTIPPENYSTTDTPDVPPPAYPGRMMIWA